MKKSRNLMISAYHKKRGTVVDMDRCYFVNTFDIGVLNKSDNSLVLENGDYILFDDVGNQHEVHLFDANLYGTIDSYKYLSGEISFKSETNDIFEANFIKWVDNI